MIALLSTRSSPASGASEVSLKAKVRVLLSDGQATRELKDTPLKIGPLPFDGFEIAIIKVGPPELSLGGLPFAVQVETKGASRDAIAMFEFVDQNGNPLSGGGGLKIEADRTVTEYAFAQEVQSATARLNLWTNLEPADVPINAKVKLGIPAVKL